MVKQTGREPQPGRAYSILSPNELLACFISASGDFACQLASSHCAMCDVRCAMFLYARGIMPLESEGRKEKKLATCFIGHEGEF